MYHPQNPGEQPLRLLDLPSEVLARVASAFDTTSDRASLLLTCHTLHTYSQQHRDVWWGKTLLDLPSEVLARVAAVLPTHSSADRPNLLISCGTLYSASQQHSRLWWGVSGPCVVCQAEHAQGFYGRCPEHVAEYREMWAFLDGGLHASARAQVNLNAQLNAFNGDDGAFPWEAQS